MCAGVVHLCACVCVSVRTCATMHHTAYSRDVQCRRVMSLVAISVRVTVAIPGQPQIVSHTYLSTPCQSKNMSDDLWLTGDCQSNSDGQGHSDKGYSSVHICDSPSIVVDCQSYYGLSDKL